VRESGFCGGAWHGVERCGLSLTIRPLVGRSGIAFTWKLAAVWDGLRVEQGIAVAHNAKIRRQIAIIGVGLL